MYSMKRTSPFTDLPYSISVDELVVVDAADDDRVDLEAAEDAMRRGDAVVDGLELIEARQRDEAIAVQRVEADGDAAEAGRLQRVDLVARAARRWW